MSDIAIRVESLSKAYRIGLKEQRHETLMGAMASFVRSPWENFRNVRKLSRFNDAKQDSASQLSPFNSHSSAIPPSAFSPQPSDVIWALRDISFQVKQGEVLGIIGRNGAGKSTLLKILARITEPTSGRATIYGRVGSLLEVGTGFHPDLTGRENVYLNGTILGMRKNEVDARFEEIVDFSGVEKFIDTPVKRYSSGMRVRLAFAVAANLEPEILIIDEVLAVGDAAFQGKCLGKMGDVARSGRTILFVSHNMAAVSNLCSRLLWLNNGDLQFSGAVEDGLRGYLDDLGDDSQETRKPLSNFRSSWATPWIKSVKIRDSRGNETSVFEMGSDIIIEVTFESPNGTTVVSPCMGVVIHHTLGGTLGAVNSRMTGFLAPQGNYGVGKLCCSLRGVPLLPGNYMLDIWYGDTTEDLDLLKGCTTLQIVGADVYRSGRLPMSHMGFIYLRADWELQSKAAHE